MKTYLLLLFCTILQFLHAGWLFLHGLGTMPPDTAIVQVVSVSDAQAVLDTYENLFLTSSLFTGITPILFSLTGLFSTFRPSPCLSFFHKE